jgi:copper chaperone NosL
VSDFRALLVLALGAVTLACSRTGDPAPASLDTASETCRSCRMPVSDAKLAAQLVSPGEEPAFFDDIGCLRDFLKDRPGAPGAIAWVADHRTGAWVRASAALYSRCPSVETPMGSHLLAHADLSSKDADATIAGCSRISAEDAFGSAPPNGRKGVR